MSIRTIYCFGNPYLNSDNWALRLAEELHHPGFRFEVVENPLDILSKGPKELLILDTVKGIEDVRLIRDVKSFVSSNSSTCHDLDLGFYLQLFSVLGNDLRLDVIGLPFKGGDYGLAKIRVLELLERL